MKHVLASLILLTIAPFAAAQPPATDYLRTNPKFLQSFRDVIRPAAGSVVRVQCDGSDTCLGVVIGGDGWILTKANDLDGKIRCIVKEGKSYDAKIVGVHDEHDLALLRIAANGLKPITWGSSASARAGGWVASVGLGEDPAAVGVVSVPTRKVNEAYLGVLLDRSPAGLVVVGVLQNGAATKAGVQAKDVIVRVNGRTFTDPESFAEFLAQRRPGDAIALSVQRDDTRHDFKAILQSRNDAGGFRAEFQNRLGSDLSNRRSGYTVILQHDSILKPSDCGGPLVDLQGRVIGLNISRAGRVESWAIPAEVLRPLLTELKSGRLAPKAKKANP